ncbi:MAG: 23S rRNA (guanosine(2251)-2'-O)-methyltransferase RlmB [Clostridia bacterium]
MIIYGKNPIAEAIRKGDTINKLYVENGLMDNSSREIIFLAKSNGVFVNFADKRKLNELCGTEKHQGFVALCVEFEYTDFNKMLEQAGENSIILILDGIEDPHNLGAILRTAEAIGVHGVVIPLHRACAVNDTVLKTSAGAVNNIKVSRVTNLSQSIQKIKSAGFWVYGLEADGKDILKQKGLSGKIALVAGSEGFGISQQIKKSCDEILSLPMFGKVNSLNVSVATGVALYLILKQN